MKREIINLTWIAIIMILTVSCKKEKDNEGTKAVFSYVTDGYVTNFTNFSTDATTYEWDFGDNSGATSTKKSPQYVYKTKGKYLVSLTAKKGDIVSTFKDTVNILGPNIKIDGDFTDWEHVEYTYVNEDNQGGTLRAVKTFANGKYLNFLLEGTDQMVLDVIVVHMDTDKNPDTGYKIDWLYPVASGTDYKLEGSFTGNWGGLAKHSGNPADGWNGFSSDIASFDETILYSPPKTVEGKKLIEFSIDRSFLGTLNGSLNFCIIENSSSYTERGSIPATGLPDGKYAIYPL
ncbi:PKD domain-containing protein (plasmid) [Pedobacter sp. BS3]|uniref:PKD domain-containing protein n=1 Tax=Pedobacter sp. BS3 TaxID=2567937 RepID=UPI0011EDBF6F|nr:PKD domain-containing protein [Pedobacter sp. BS3]TZF85695.1 PKD domain-containing protein [Pedobacter sp. BS3]